MKLADTTIIIHPDTEDKFEAIKAFMKAFKIKFEVSEKSYNPDFVDKIIKSRADYKAGKGTAMNLDELKSLCK